MSWKKRRETELERELRAQRPQPRAELVQLLCRESATAQRSLRGLFPRIALVGAVTVVLAASLGAAGAVGYATKSVHALSTSVLHVVQSPSTLLHSGKTNGSQFGNKGNGNGQLGGDGDDHGRDPFHREYDHRVPICHHGQVVFVPSREYFYRLLHGDTPAPCHRRHRRR
ncbi:MAG: hypothetical protein ACXVZW_09740 [Gaiellaceae bacterium]